MTEKELQRKINRAKLKLANLEERKDNLSKFGYWDMGYLQGKIAVLEDWLDLLKEGDCNEHLDYR